MADLAGLPRRQREAAGLVAQGLSNRQGAERMGTSEGAFKQLVSRALIELGLSNRVQLALAHLGTDTESGSAPAPMPSGGTTG